MVGDGIGVVVNVKVTVAVAVTCGDVQAVINVRKNKQIFFILSLYALNKTDL
jgi:hypothetical protein